MVNVHPVAADEHGNITDRKVLAKLKDVPGLGGDPLQWQTSRAFDVTQPPRLDDRPTVTWAAGEATTMTTPVEYRPHVLRTGVQITNWDGQDDPVFSFAPGKYRTGWNTNSDKALEGEIKPGGEAQYAGWPMIFTVVTSATDKLETAWQGGVSGMGLLFEVNGRMVDDVVRTAPTFPGSTATVTLTFPTPAVRTIRIWALYKPSFIVARVPAGASLSKPTTAGRTAAIVGDSFVNGSGGSHSYPDQGAIVTETFAPRLLRTLGYDRIMLAGIGGSGWLTANPYSQRIPVILESNPQLVVFYGSVNDGPNPAGLKQAVRDTLAMVASVPEVVVIPHGVGGYDGAIQQIREATAESGRRFVEWGQFFTGTGRVGAPQGDGNRDYYIRTDGTHPTLDGHRAMARALFEAITEPA